jgi:hypothetical protein
MKNTVIEFNSLYLRNDRLKEDKQDNVSMSDRIVIYYDLDDGCENYLKNWDLPQTMF